MIKLLKYFLPCVLIALFLFLRFYNINNSFFFINDMGRDMLVLQNWKNIGRPPLLGPQTSALPFNQSAIYFYLLYPGYLISQGNPISSIYTLAVIYVLSLIIGLYLLKKDKLLSKIILISFFLISIHPQYIIQSRFVWNPSFVTPFLIISIISFYLLQKKYSLIKLIIFSLSIATAVSISYSVAPLFIVFAIYWLLFTRSKFWSYVLSLFSSFFLINLPTIFFELRHHFFLTSSLLTKKSPLQEGLLYSTRFNNLSNFIFSTNNTNLDKILFTSLIILSLYLLYKNRNNPKSLPFIAPFLYLGITLLSFITPISIHSHYIFAYTSLIFILISTFKKIYLYISLLFFSFVYLQPSQLKSYFKDSPRTYRQMQTCFKNYCQSHPDPTFVSVQSDYLPFHNGPEHRYLLRDAGCNIKDIESENGEAKYMSVILDDATFDEKTTFYELELFGKFKNIETFECIPNFKIKVLEKI